MKPPRPEGEYDVDRLAEIAGHVTGTSVPDRSQRPEVTSRLGTVLRGKYRLESVLGVGGMAVVYRAIHRNQAEYAIKMLLPEHAANEELRSRFLREGYAANSVKHPGAVRVVDDDVAEDGAAFLVLELLDGIACDKLCAARGGRLPVAAVCAIGLQALDVLRSAHLNGIIHRDIKPANLFLLRSGEVKVLDFGIARVRETLATGAHSTGSGVLLGTPAFMAPEQAMGKANEIDARADIWAIGAALFAMMSGLTVHEGDSGRELIVKLVTQPPRSLLTVVPEVPKPVAEVIDRALAGNRDGRWPSAAEMRDALDAASRPLWQDRPPRSTLVSLAEPMVPEALGGTKASVDPGTPKGSQVPAAAPTLRAQERPEKSDAPPKATVETARAVSHSGTSIGPRRRSRLVLLVTLGTGAIAAAFGAMTMQGRNESPQRVSPSAPAAETVTATADTPVVASPAVPASPPAESAVLPSDGGRAARSRTAPKQERDAPATNAAASPSISPANTSSAAPAAPAAAHSETTPNCTPPYYYDSKMNRVFKKECL